MLALIGSFVLQLVGMAVSFLPVLVGASAG